MELSETVTRDLKGAAEGELQVWDRHSLSFDGSPRIEYKKYFFFIQNENNNLGSDEH